MEQIGRGAAAAAVTETIDGVKPPLLARSLQERASSRRPFRF
jgi:hypothetical protein